MGRHYLAVFKKFIPYPHSPAKPEFTGFIRREIEPYVFLMLLAERESKVWMESVYIAE